MATAAIYIPEDWSKAWLQAIRDYIDLEDEYPNSLAHLYEAACCFLQWRFKCDPDSKSFHHIVMDILHGYQLTDVGPETLIPYWERLYLEVETALRVIAQHGHIRSIECVFERELTHILVVVYEPT